VAVVAIAALCLGCAGDANTTPIQAEGDAATTSPNDSAGPEQAVIVHLVLSGEGFGTPADRDRVYELEDDLIAAVEAAGVGEYDGNEFGEGEAALYAYGPDADALFAVMEPVITAFGPGAGSFAIKRYGDAGNPAAEESQVPLG
jgi:hypothetical protein